MAFTQADLLIIDGAILALAKGTRVTEVRMSDRTLRYSEVRIEELNKLREQVLVALDPLATVKRRRIYRSTYAKGL